MNQYIHEFRLNMQALLEKRRDAFIEEVKSAIRENGDISDEAKECVLAAIQEPEIKPFFDVTKTFEETYEDDVTKTFGETCADNMSALNFSMLQFYTTRTTQTILSLWYFINFTGTGIEDAEDKLVEIAKEMANNCEKGFKAGLDGVLFATMSKLYPLCSTLMQARLADKEAMDQLGKMIGKMIAEAASKLEARQEELEEMIWEGKKNEE